MNSNKAMMARRSDAVPRGVGQIHPIFAERAENCRVWDVEGREYLDFAGGIACLHGHLAVATGGFFSRCGFACFGLARRGRAACWCSGGLSRFNGLRSRIWC